MLLFREPHPRASVVVPSNEVDPGLGEGPLNDLKRCPPGQIRAGFELAQRHHTNLCFIRKDLLGPV